MKKSIYKILTVEYKLEVRMDALNFLSTQFADDESIKVFAKSFINKFGTAQVDLEKVNQILKLIKEETPIFKISEVKYKDTPLEIRFETICKYLPAEFGYSVDDELITTIYTKSQESNPKVPKIIKFSHSKYYRGIYYRDKINYHRFEIANRMYQMNFDFYEENMVLFDKMFIGCSGVVCDDTIYVRRIILPDIPIKSFSNFTLRKIYNKIIAFSSLCDNSNITSIISNHNPSLIIYSTKSKNFLEEPSVFCSSSSDYMELLPKKRTDINDSNYSTNPFIVELSDKRIAFIDSDVFKYKESCSFFNSMPFDSFYNSYVSQGAFNPIGIPVLLFPEIPNVFVIAQDAQPFVKKFSNQMILISLSPFNTGAYAIIDFENDIYEIEFLN